MAPRHQKILNKILGFVYFNIFYYILILSYLITYLWCVYIYISYDYYSTLRLTTTMTLEAGATYPQGSNNNIKP